MSADTKVILLHYTNSTITIADNLITCSYEGPFDTIKWQIILNDKDLCYQIDKKKECRFQVNEIKEFQFEMGNGGRRYGDIPAAIAYVVFKDDPDPKDFFYFLVSEIYTYANQTRAYDFCDKILNHISERYGIPVNYKLSIDTKKKQRNLIWLPIILILTFLLIWIRLRLGD